MHCYNFYCCYWSMQAALESVRPRISRDLFTVYEKFQSENRSKAV